MKMPAFGVTWTTPLPRIAPDPRRLSLRQAADCRPNTNQPDPSSQWARKRRHGNLGGRIKKICKTLQVMRVRAMAMVHRGMLTQRALHQRILARAMRFYDR